MVNFLLHRLYLQKPNPNSPPRGLGQALGLRNVASGFPDTGHEGEGDSGLQRGRRAKAHPVGSRRRGRPGLPLEPWLAPWRGAGARAGP